MSLDHFSCPTGLRSHQRVPDKTLNSCSGQKIVEFNWFHSENIIDMISGCLICLSCLLADD